MNNLLTMIPTEPWMLQKIPQNNTDFNEETWLKVTIETRKRCVARARAYKKLNRELTLQEETDLMGSWCCGGLPHPPIYYFPEVHAKAWVKTVGFSMNDGIIQRRRAECPLCKELE